MTDSEIPARRLSPSVVYLMALLLAAGMIGFKVWQVSGGGKSKVERFGHQEAGSPLVLPEKGEPDFRLDGLTVWEAAQVPKSLRFDPPLGSEQGGLAYNGQKFWEMNEARKGHHTGDDLNGIGGMNTDLGDPVFAVADGLVVFAGEPTPEWGNVVIVAHRGPDGNPLESMYAHLDRVEIERGALVARGARIGTVGTANGYYPAHLHFEMRAGDGVDLGGGYAMQRMNRLDPTETVKSLRNAAPEGLSGSPLGKVIAEMK